MRVDSFFTMKMNSFLCEGKGAQQKPPESGSVLQPAPATTSLLPQQQRSNAAAALLPPQQTFDPPRAPNQSMAWPRSASSPDPPLFFAQRPNMLSQQQFQTTQVTPAFQTTQVAPAFQASQAPPVAYAAPPPAALRARPVRPAQPTQPPSVLPAQLQQPVQATQSACAYPAAAAQPQYPSQSNTVPWPRVASGPSGLPASSAPSFGSGAAPWQPSNAPAPSAARNGDAPRAEKTRRQEQPGMPPRRREQSEVPRGRKAPRGRERQLRERDSQSLPPRSGLPPPIDQLHACAERMRDDQSPPPPSATRMRDDEVLPESTPPRSRLPRGLSDQKVFEEAPVDVDTGTGKGAVGQRRSPGSLPPPLRPTSRVPDGSEGQNWRMTGAVSRGSPRGGPRVSEYSQDLRVRKNLGAEPESSSSWWSTQWLCC